MIFWEGDFFNKAYNGLIVYRNIGQRTEHGTDMSDMLRK